MEVRFKPKRVGISGTMSNLGMGIAICFLALHTFIMANDLESWDGGNILFVVLSVCQYLVVLYLIIICYLPSYV